MTTTPPSSPGSVYREAAVRHETARREAHRASVRLSTVRALTFIASATGFLLWDILEGSAATAGLVAGGLMALVFFWEIRLHRRRREAERWEGALEQLAREGLHRVERSWDALEEGLPEAERTGTSVDARHPYARDLDVAGRASLLRILGPVTSRPGRDRVLGWLLTPASPDEVRTRQQAVQELAPLRDVRTEFAAHGRLEAEAKGASLEPFLTWAEGESWLGQRPLYLWAARILPPILLVLGLGDIFWGWAPWWLIPTVAQLWVLNRTSGALGKELGAAESGGGPLRGYVPQIQMVEDHDWTASRLLELHGHLTDDGVTASTHLQGLSRLLDTVQSRRNMFWATLVLLLLLDVHLAHRLDRWRGRHGTSVRRWLDALAEWESLSALATLAHDHPAWCWPEMDASSESPLLEARGLGHPLLPDRACVRNDVSVGPPGSFLLVTGSNMSGKSTLLRALGTNTVLAQAGAPVCAEALRLPPLRVHTSMRIDDSLAQGVSLFMAELLRVRDIVRAADAAGPPVLYLLDEILHGTNTAERRVAARGIIRHLLQAGAIGAVSTHDLTLARSPELEKAAEAVHFREEVEEVQEDESGPSTRLLFDYSLRSGIATTRNALKLLEAVGLGGLELNPEDEDPTDGRR